MLSEHILIRLFLYFFEQSLVQFNAQVHVPRISGHPRLDFPSHFHFVVSPHSANPHSLRVVCDVILGFGDVIAGVDVDALQRFDDVLV